MMSASDYRARAAALVASADNCADDELVLAFEGAAREWRRLADIADWQDALQLALANSASE
jgi:CelD/BcsL family acetyltransferase involved in cellulose biosynthesis